MSKVILLVLASVLSIVAFVASYPSPKVNPDSDEGIEEIDPNFNSSIQGLMSRGTQVDQLLSVGTFNAIEEEPVDYEHTKTGCSIPANVQPKPKNGLTNENARWYNSGDGKFIIPCVVSPQYTQQERDLLYAAMIEIQNTTCIKFYIYGSANDLRGYDFVDITKNAEGCWSEGLGRMRKGRQQMNLQPTDSQGLTCMIKGIAVHELLHVIGFHHQQNTPGRNEYVNILWNNIQDDNGARYQFQELSSNEASSFGAPYDYGSIMHYAKKDFSKNGGDTIQARRQGVTFGQRQRISDWDAVKVNRMYNCNK